mmetsp:Transcript_35638/g.67234  ORF Transcript_35638/g.67234 Transcript_35638/m.67234 type:complete len:381 (-) Transcript_35638:227-1369(-)
MRSDTVTLPTAEMRVAMALAEVGDDVFEDDPTVGKLEKKVAGLLGKEAGLFVPTGTMGNLISVMVHCERRGSEVILGSESHIHIYEQGGIAQIGGIHPRALPNMPDGTIDLSLVEAAVRSSDVHFPVTQVLILENTHNKKGGRVLTLKYMEEAANLCKKHNLKLHIDGARLFNAATTLQKSPAELVKHADSVSVCLSKALGTPAGSVIVGTRDFVCKARRTRKVLGGGMRQVGVLAAAGLVALEDWTEKLASDHARAQTLALAINNKCQGYLKVDLDSVQSNLVYIDTGALDAAPIAAEVGEYGVRVLAVGPRTIRACCHSQVTDRGVERAVQAFQCAAESAHGSNTTVTHGKVQRDGAAAVAMSSMPSRKRAAEWHIAK